MQFGGWTGEAESFSELIYTDLGIKGRRFKSPNIDLEMCDDTKELLLSKMYNGILKWRQLFSKWKSF